MTIMKVYRNASGVVRNIGEWDHLRSEETDDLGNVTVTIGNPLPAHYVVSDEEVVTGWDGGLYAAGDPRAEAH